MNGRETCFLFRTEAPATTGWIRIYSVSGQRVKSLRVRMDHFTGGDAAICWWGHDNENDQLANGIYLYRVELDSPLGTVASGMQRLVLMR